VSAENSSPEFVKLELKFSYFYYGSYSYIQESFLKVSLLADSLRIGFLLKDSLRPGNLTPLITP
jgi:hypothetical protein